MTKYSGLTRVLRLKIYLPFSLFLVFKVLIFDTLSHSYLRVHIIAIYVILESAHLRSTENGTSLRRGLIFKTLKPTWCIQRKKSINSTSIMKKPHKLFIQTAKNIRI